MSHRPIETKKRNRVAKQLRRKSLPAYFNLVDWLIAHKHAKTKKEARAIIMAKRVQANTHTLGIGMDMRPIKGRLGKEMLEAKEGVNPNIPVSLKRDIIVLSNAAS